jgi:hypothetical protein
VTKSSQDGNEIVSIINMICIANLNGNCGVHELLANMYWFGRRRLRLKS